ncbi:MAG TPA: glycosyltransferase family 4 protein [Terriglobales bacterium]|nr:glycosyltransferase family 4 protein [Terriglobales bacterium]
MSHAPKHVLVTADTIGGVWTYARELVTGLAKRGVRVTLVSFGEIPKPDQTQWLEGLPNVEFRPTAFKLEWMQDVEADLEASAEYLACVVSEVKPDLLHLNQFYYGALPVDVPRVVVAHSDVVSWWMTVHGTEPPDSAWIRWYRQSLQRGIAEATAVVAPSTWMLEQVRKYYWTAARGSVIYNGRTPSLFNPHVTKEGYGLGVGRIWDAGKQVTLLAQAEPAMPFYIVGAEEHPELALRGRGMLSGTTLERVHFKGEQTEAQLRQLFGRASVYAATSRYEPFGLAALEAALSRCAIVANDIPTFREVWGDDVLYFAHNDAASLGELLQSLNDDPALQSEYANRAYRRAMQRYTTDRMVEDYMALYVSLTRAEVLAA